MKPNLKSSLLLICSGLWMTGSLMAQDAREMVKRAVQSEMTGSR